MSSILNLTNPAVRRNLRLALTSVIATVLTAVFVQTASAQCVDHPDKKTAVQFNNESRFELTFFVDNDEKGVVVAARAVSIELEVEPGEHLFRARAVVRGESFWVSVVNEVPEGQVCTWTITDPPHGTGEGNNIYRTAIGPGPKGKNIKRKRLQ